MLKVIVGKISAYQLSQIWLTTKRFIKQQNSTHNPFLKLNGISSVRFTDKTNILGCHSQSTNSSDNCSSTFKNIFPLISYTLQHKLRN